MKWSDLKQEIDLYGGPLTDQVKLTMKHKIACAIVNLLSYKESYDGKEAWFSLDIELPNCIETHILGTIKNGCSNKKSAYVKYLDSTTPSYAPPTGIECAIEITKAAEITEQLKVNTEYELQMEKMKKMMNAMPPWYSYNTTSGTWMGIKREDPGHYGQKMAQVVLDKIKIEKGAAPKVAKKVTKKTKP